MKRVISALLSVLLLSVLAACSRDVGQSENSDIGALKTAIGETGTDSNSADTGKDVNGSLIEFEAQYIRTDGYREDGKYPIVKIIRSVEELNTYYNENKGKYNLERRTDPSTDSTIGFLDACDEYNADYFENRILIMVLLEEGSGSIRHNVDSVKYGSDGKLYIDIEKSSTEVGTCDMALWHILIEPESNITIAAESDVVVYLDRADPNSQPTVVREYGAYSNITLSIPTGWEYETERMEDSGYCIAFWPEGFDGKIKMCYYPFFGVCGTGLECEAVTVGNYDGVKGSYGSKNSWYFISFNNVPGSYAAINEGADKWWDRYGDEAMQILGTVRIADGIIDEAQAIEIAAKSVDVKYDRVKAVFDAEKGVWNIRFYEKNTQEEVRSITVSYNGKLNNEVSK